MNEEFISTSDSKTNQSQLSKQPEEKHIKVILSELRKLSSISEEFSKIRENTLKEMKSFKSALEHEVNAINNIIKGLDSTKTNGNSKLAELEILLKLIDKPEIKSFLRELAKPKEK